MPTFLQVAFDADDAEAIARFWAEVLDAVVEDGASSASAAVSPRTPGAHPRLVFHHVPEGKTVKNRVHLDVASSDPEADITRFRALGAARLVDRRAEDGSLRWSTLADPEGNEFDLVVR